MPNKKTASMEIRYETYGIPNDCEKKSFTVTSVSLTICKLCVDTGYMHKSMVLPEIYTQFECSIRVLQRVTREQLKRTSNPYFSIYNQD